MINHVDPQFFDSEEVINQLDDVVNILLNHMQENHLPFYSDINQRYQLMRSEIIRRLSELDQIYFRYTDE